MANEETVLRQYRQGQMAKRIREETDDVLNHQEKLVVDAVMKELSSGNTLDPQFAVQQWLALFSIRRFRRALEQKERQARSAAGKMGENLT